MKKSEAEEIVKRIIDDGRRCFRETPNPDLKYEINFLFGWLQSSAAGILSESNLKYENFDESGLYNKITNPQK